MKNFHHGVVGDLSLTYEALEAPGDPGQTIFVYMAEPNSPSQEALGSVGQLVCHISRALDCRGRARGLSFYRELRSADDEGKAFTGLRDTAFPRDVVDDSGRMRRDPDPVVSRLEPALGLTLEEPLRRVNDGVGCRRYHDPSCPRLS